MKPHTSLRSYPWKQAQKTLKIMGDRWLDRLGNWNPQLLYELKRNRTPDKMASVALSLVFIQLLFCCLVVMVCGDTFQSSWLFWFHIDSAAIMGTLLFCGSFLSENWKRDNNQKNWELIWLTPCSSQQLLLGKLLGVPSLVYWATIWLFPLQVWLGLRSGIQLIDVLLIDTSILLLKVMMILISMLLDFFQIKRRDSQKSQLSSILGIMALGAIAIELFLFNIVVISTYNECQIAWFGYWLSHGFRYFMILGISIVGSFSLWLWYWCNQKFNSPSSAVISKKQSYLLTLSFSSLMVAIQVFCRGLTTQLSVAGLQTIHEIDGEAYTSVIHLWLSSSTMICFLMFLTSGLDADFQGLHRSASEQNCLSRNQERSSSIEQERRWTNIFDWLFNDCKPSTLTIVFNYLLMILIWLPWIWILSFYNGYHFLLIMVCGAPVWLLLMIKSLNQEADTWSQDEINLDRWLKWRCQSIGRATIDWVRGKPASEEKNRRRSIFEKNLVFFALDKLLGLMFLVGFFYSCLSGYGLIQPDWPCQWLMLLSPDTSLLKDFATSEFHSTTSIFSTADLCLALLVGWTAVARLIHLEVRRFNQFCCQLALLERINI